MNTLLLLTLSLLPALQDQGMTETSFHRVYLHNGNFVDGDLIQETPAAVTLKLKYGDMTIPRDQISRVELVRMAQLAEPVKPAAQTQEKPDPQPSAVPPTGKAPPATTKPESQPGTSKPLPDSATDAGKGAKAVLEELRKASPDRISALVQKLVETGPEGAEYLAGALSKVEDKLIPIVGDALVQIKNRETLPVIVEHLSNGKAAVRFYAMRVITALDDHSAAPSVRPLLKDPDAEIRSCAVDTLLNLDDIDSLDNIGMLCSDAEAPVRSHATNAVIKLANKHDKKEQLQSILRDAMRESSGDALGDIVMAIGRTRNKEMWSLVAPVLTDDSIEARAAAAIALKDLNAVESIPAIMDRLTAERERRVRIQLAGTVQAMRLPQAIGPLVEWISESDLDIKMAACRALKDITGKNFGTTYADWSAWWEGVKPKQAE